MLKEKLHAIGIIPVIAIEDVEDALPLANALIKGGLPAAEVTFRTDCAKEVIERMSQAYPDLLVGAGTVLTCRQVDDAIEAGAKFIVSPGLNPEIVKYCQSKGIEIIPGISNASEIEQALSLGLSVVKFFPAEPLGGLKMIKALAGPYKQLQFMPTGGINPKNVKEYLQANEILCCGGTWMVDAKALKNKDFKKIEQLTKEALQTMLDLKLVHVGVNKEEAKEAFEDLLGLHARETNVSYFVGNTIEIMKEDRGTHGHIAYSTNNVDRCKYFYEAKGYTFDEAYTAYDLQGKCTNAYLKEEIGGFRIHFIKED